MEKACKKCKRLVKKAKECPVCRNNDLTTSWRSILIVYDPESKIAKKANISSPGKFAIRVRG